MKLGEKHMSPTKKRLWLLASTLAFLLFLIGCQPPSFTPAPERLQPAPPPTVDHSDPILETLNSLEQVDDYPLYTMHYVGSYQRATAAASAESVAVAERLTWGCSLFTTSADPGNGLMGRNFDWQYSPALLLFTDPPDGYASVSMVDIEYIGFGGEKAAGISELPLEERRSLLDAPFLPFDGMNERGLAVGMAAVPAGNVVPDPNKETVGSLGIIREMLDHAATVDEAVAIMQSYNVDMSDGTPIHYLIADATGHAALVEYYDGDMVVIPSENAWHQATNFLRSQADEEGGHSCQRYDKISERMAETSGLLSVQDAFGLLADVSQPSTQWSIVYGINSGDISVVMGREYEIARTFQLERAGE